MIAPSRDTRWWQERRLPKLLLPSGGLLAVLEAFFDESERPGGTFCVAGYVFSALQVERFSAQWLRVMGPYWPFHMKEFVHRRDQRQRPTKFEGLTNAEHDGLIKRAVQIINQHTMLSISVSCNINDVKRVAPILQGIEGRAFENAYSLCCYLCMALLANWLQERKLPDVVAYVFESGNRFQARTDHFMREITFHPFLRRQMRYEAHAFVDKSDSAPLQAADLFAWELTKFLDETAIDGSGREPRRSLKALVQPNPQRYEGRILGAKSLERYYRELATKVFHREKA